MKTLKARLAKFSRMLAKTAEPIWDNEQSGFAMGRAVLGIPLLSVPTFIVVVIFGK